MRKALNENPVVQIAVIGVLVLVVGLFFMATTKKKGGSESSASSAARLGFRFPSGGTTAPVDGLPGGHGRPQLEPAECRRQRHAAPSERDCHARRADPRPGASAAGRSRLEGRGCDRAADRPRGRNRRPARPGAPSSRSRATAESPSSLPVPSMWHATRASRRESGWTRPQRSVVVRPRQRKRVGARSAGELRVPRLPECRSVRERCALHGQGRPSLQPQVMAYVTAGATRIPSAGAGAHGGIPGGGRDRDA